MLILSGDQTTEGVVAIAADTRARQLFLDQFALGVPHQEVLAAVRMLDFQQAPAGVVAVAGALAERVDLLGDIALGVAFVFPDRLAAPHAAHLAIEIAVVDRLALSWDAGLQTPGLVV